jgi:hypothetical protein
MRWCETRPAFCDECKSLQLMSLKTLAHSRMTDGLTCWYVRSPSTQKLGHAQRLEYSDNESACVSAFYNFCVGLRASISIPRYTQNHGIV